MTMVESFSNNSSLQYMLDRSAVEEVISGFALVQDVKKFMLVEKFLSEDVVFDYVSVFGGEPFSGRTNIFEWILTRIPGYDATQHLISNFQITIEGRFARVRSHVRATLVIDDSSCIIGGHYLHELHKEGDGRWRITLLRFTKLYSEGDAAVPVAAATRAAAWLADNPLVTDQEAWL
ncbi:nuclear transport factor 2 family protein (plasmid) [Sphingomonas paeninsulae]|uniref:Nuclear transport factor 2 family protein n=1 Tax=Sphingomonas paeninsulae TaxID=2319844 RepID=A0A494T695_SPHPE|nr:nuclear transport factor 2 family protein [Sphingomonas paeninsulae]AYJ84857.1 nuclear transport factor 2 family protein [Sphingomonas paeninsulae]